MTPETITTERLLLRPWRVADAERVFEYASEWDLARMTSSIPHPYTRAMADAYVRGETTSTSEIAYAIDDGAGIVGAVGLKQAGAPELGYWIGAPHRGKGYAGEAAAALCDMAFTSLGATTIEACVFTDNPTSAKVLERLGFRHAYDCVDDSRARGEKVPSAHYALTRADWEALR